MTGPEDTFDTDPVGIVLDLARSDPMQWMLGRGERAVFQCVHCWAPSNPTVPSDEVSHYENCLWERAVAWQPEDAA